MEAGKLAYHKWQYLNWLNHREGMLPQVSKASMSILYNKRRCFGFGKNKLSGQSGNIESDKLKLIKQCRTLISSGLITGEALVGIFMAIPIVVAGRSDVLAFLGIHDLVLPGILILLVMLYVIYKAGAPGMKSGKE